MNLSQFRCSPDDERLILDAVTRLAEHKDEEAAVLLWHFFCEPIKATARDLLRGRQTRVDEEEIAQEVFSDFFRRLREKRFEPPSTIDEVLRLLWHVVRNYEREYFRRASAAKRDCRRLEGSENATSDADAADDLDSLPVRDDTPETEAIERESLEGLYKRLEAVKHALQQMPNRDELHEIFEMMTEGRSNKEIAKKLGQSVSAVNRGVKTIKDLLEVAETDPLRSKKRDPKTPILRVRPPRVHLPYGGTEIMPEDSKAVTSEAGLLPTSRSQRAAHDASFDPVDCTVFAPPEVNLGDMVMVQVFAHIPTRADEACSRAVQFDEEAQPRGYTSLETEIRRGSKLCFKLSLPGARIDLRHLTLLWTGQTASVQFRIIVPNNCTLHALVGTVTATNEEQIPLGQVTFKLKVLHERTASLPGPAPTGTAKSFDVFFISYASEDRAKVLARVQMLKLLGKRFYQDLLDLDPGDRWEKKLYLFIDQSDATLLFWSNNAKNSEWVMRECRYTIDKKGIDRLLPVIIEGPPLVEPPEELRELHMNDWLLYLIR